MTRRRAVKLLMAHGYSRNQAAELMRARPAGWSNARQYVDVVTAPDVERIADAFRFLADICAAMRNPLLDLAEAVNHVGRAYLMRSDEVL